MSNGLHVVLGLESHSNLTTLQLRGPNIEISNKEEVYGDVENTGKTFEMDEEHC